MKIITNNHQFVQIMKMILVFLNSYFNFQHLQGKVQSLEVRLEKFVKNNIALQSEGNLEAGITFTPRQSSSNLNKYSRKCIHFYTPPTVRTRDTFCNIQSRPILRSEPTEFDTSTDSSLTSEKPITDSLIPDEEQLFWSERLSISRSSSPHENLHSELIKIGNTVRIKAIIMYCNLMNNFTGLSYLLRAQTIFSPMQRRNRKIVDGIGEPTARNCRFAFKQKRSGKKIVHCLR